MSWVKVVKGFKAVLSFFPRKFINFGEGRHPLVKLLNKVAKCGWVYYKMKFDEMSEIYFGSESHILKSSCSVILLKIQLQDKGKFSRMFISKLRHLFVLIQWTFKISSQQTSWLRLLFITLKCFISNILKAKVPVVQIPQNILQFPHKYCFICPKLKKLTRFGILVSVCCPLNSRNSWYQGRKQILYIKNNLSQNLQRTDPGKYLKIDFALYNGSIIFQWETIISIFPVCVRTCSDICVLWQCPGKEIVLDVGFVFQHQATSWIWSYIDCDYSSVEVSHQLLTTIMSDTILILGCINSKVDNWNTNHFVLWSPQEIDFALSN